MEDAKTLEIATDVSFWFQLIFMILGAILPILLYSLYRAGKFWEWYYFFYDNLWRWIAEFCTIIILQTILYFQGDGVLQALTAIGVVFPSFSSAGIGVIISIFVVKTIPTSPMIPPQNLDNG
jgi:hypothetical protein